MGLLNLIDCRARNVAAVGAAHLRQLIGRRGRAPGAGAVSLGLPPAYWRHVAGEVVVAVGREYTA